MIDISIEKTCRICLEEDVKYNLFGSTDDIQSKIFLCFNEKIENIEGFPCNICSKCYDTINLICDFKRKFESSRKILEGKLIQVEIKCENNDYSDVEIDTESFSDIMKTIPKEEPKIIKPEELLKSLKDMTVKKIKTSHKKNSRKDLSSELSINAKKPNKNPTLSNTTLKSSKSSAGSKKSSCLSGTLKSTKKRNKKPRNSSSINKSDKLLPNEKSEEACHDESDTKKCKDEKEIDKLKKTDKESGPSICDVCGKTCSKYSNLVQHKKIHEGNGKIKFKCEKCPRQYNTKYSLNEHILKIHENVKNAVCETCGKKYFNAKQLLVHVKFVHKKIRKKQTIYKCRFCDRTCHYKRGIVVHERSTHTGERPAICSVCQSAFYDEAYLREHMRLHTGSTPYKCPICNRGYAQRCNMKSHMRNHRISELGPDVLKSLKPNYLKFLRP